MSLAKAYTEAYGKLGEFFGKLRDGQAPERFTHQLLLTRQKKNQWMK